MKQILILVLLLGFNTLFGQNYITGFVKSLDTDIPLVDVSIYNSKGNVLAKTNKLGEFSFSTNLIQDKLTFYLESYRVYEQLFNYKKSKNILVDLIPFSEEISAVEIIAYKRKVFALKHLKEVEGTSVFSGKKTEVVLMSELVGNRATNNARQIYSQVVGLNIYENDDAGLQLNIGGRGLDPNRTSNFNTRQNGYDMSADVLGYPESYYSPPSDAIKEIQVVRGAASLQYGTQFGGLLNFKLLEPPKDRELELLTRHSIGSNGLYNTYNSFTGTSGKISYFSFLNYKQGDGFRPNSAFNSLNVFASTTYSHNDKTSLSVEMTYLDYLAKQAGGLTDTQFNRDINFSNRERNWFAVNWNLWAIKFKHDFSEDTKYTFNLFGLYAMRRAIGFRSNYITQNPTNPITDKDTKSVFSGHYLIRDLIIGKYQNWGAETKLLTSYHLFGEKQIYMFGLKYYNASNTEEQGAGSRGKGPDFRFNYKENDKYVSDVRFRFPNENLALFGEHIFKINKCLSITPGFRLEYIKTQSLGRYKNVSMDNAGNIYKTRYINDPNIKDRKFYLLGIGLSYKRNKFIEMYTNASQNYRSVTFNDIRTTSPSFVVDEAIGDESGVTFDLGFRGKYNDFFSFDIGGFGLLYNQRIGEIIAGREYGKYYGDRMRTNIGDAIIYGFESFINLNWAKVIGVKQSNYIFTNFLNLAITDSKYKTSRQAGISGNKVEFIPFLNLKTGIKSGYKNFLTNIQYTYLSEQYTEATNSKAALQGSFREGLVGEIPAYSILDVSFSYKYKYWKLEAGLNNVLDKNYFTRRATGYPGPGIIPSPPRTWFTTLEYKF